MAGCTRGKIKKTRIDIPVGEWPKLESMSSSSSNASSTVSQDSTGQITPVPKTSAYNATQKEYCVYFARNTHSTENCKLLHLSVENTKLRVQVLHQHPRVR
eukprot:168170-Prymnesium_polylepis.1